MRCKISSWHPRRSSPGTMLRKMKADQAPEAAGGGAAVAKARGSSFFTVPRLLVGFTAKCLSDCDAASRSPTSPLDLRAFSFLGGSLLRSPRSPRSWDSARVGLGLVDSLAEGAKNCSDAVLFNRQRSLRSFNSLPRDCGMSSARSPRRPDAAGELGKTRSCPSGDIEAGLKSGSGAVRPAAPCAGEIPGSLPVSIAAAPSGPRRYAGGSLSASDIELSEDYTCVIAHGPNPKTTHIFGDCILELKDSSWLVKRPVAASEDFLRSCFSCRKKLEGSDIYIYRGEKAFCSGSCRDQEILVEEEGENEATAGAPGSACSSFHDDIFMAGMVVAT